MLLKKHKGIALVTAIMISAVLSILVISILGVSLADKNHAVNYDKNSQAHYIARSGIAVGLKVLDNELSDLINEIKDDPSKTITIDSLVSTANSYANQSSNLKNVAFKDASANIIGTYSISYEKFGPEQVKIISDAEANGSTNPKDRVTLIINVKTGTNYYTNPAEWLNGGSQTLQTGVSTNNHLKHSVKLNGKGNSIKIPSNSGNGANDSIYKAQIIYFTDEKGTSFQQLNNVIGVTFDAEIIFFESAVEISTPNNKTPDPVCFTLSDELINSREEGGGVIPKTNTECGFESYESYKAFIGTETADEWGNYNFDSTKHYGVVKFGGGVKNNGTFINYKGEKLQGYYFFKSGVDLHNINDGDFIKINDDDAIIKVIDNLINPSINRNGRIWSDN